MTRQQGPGRATHAEGNRLAFRLYDLAIGDEDARLCRDIPEEQCREQAGSFVRQVLSQALSKTGDVLADSKVVLPWLLGTVGAPVFLVGLLVPIRESLALLPQVLVGGLIRRFPVRKGFWAGSSLVEGLCVILMGVVATLGVRGAAAGWAIVGLLAIFSLARGIASVAAKDTLAKTVSKGRRGRVNGHAAAASGVIAGAVGLYLALSPADARPDWILLGMIIAAGSSWMLAAVVFLGIREHPGATEGGRSLAGLVREQVVLLFSDRELQKFLAARTLMISTALLGPIYVGLAQREAGLGLDSLGWLVVAAGLSSAASSIVWGALSDRSSRLTMAFAAALAGALGVLVLIALALVPVWSASISFYAAILFVLGIAHAGVRIGRKTHLVDMAGADRKSEYVALSNTLIGILLLCIGGLVSLLLGFGLEVGVAMLSLMALAGAGLALSLKEAQA